jgi:hypothetical protein
MDRGIAGVLAAATVALLLVSAVARGEAPKKEPSRQGPAAPEKKGSFRLEEVKITGSVEHPGVLFFLPRAKFRLLPSRTEQDWKANLLRDDREKGEIP